MQRASRLARFQRLLPHHRHTALPAPMSVRITALYAAPLAALFLHLSLRVIKGRRSGKVALGDAGNKSLLRRIRAQANFAEYVPFSLLLIGLSESLGTMPVLVHASGLALLLGRISHAYGVSREPENFRFRVWGMISTFSAIVTSGTTCLIGALR